MIIIIQNSSARKY